MRGRGPGRPDLAAEEAAGWQELVGYGVHKVLVFEHLQRKRVLYLRWRAGGNWKYESLKRTLSDERTSRRLAGRALEDVKEWARAEADRRFRQNRGELAEIRVVEEAPPPPAPLTLAEGLKKACDPTTGAYPAPTEHRRDVTHQVMIAAHILRTGEGEATWEGLTRASWTKLWRTRFEQLRAEGHEGLGGAEKMISRLTALATWLRDHELIPAGAAVPPSTWKAMLRSDFATIYGGGELPEKSRPRYTAEESRQLIAVAHEIDPRLGLLLALGAELRAGQVRKRWRSDLELPPIDWAAIAAMTPEQRLEVNFGTFRTRASGKKGGAIVDLTRGQRYVVDLALAGYLRELEQRRLAGELADYPLFPGGRLTKTDTGLVARPGVALERPLSKTNAGKFLALAEERVGTTADGRRIIPHVEGRLFYGLRRSGVDAATETGISAGALQQLGGWSSPVIPMQIYKDQESARDRRVARNVRAKMRGEEA